MALTISQVNQGFLALFGRPATGAEATKFASQADVATLSNSLLADPYYAKELSNTLPKIKTVDLNAATDDAFVESLYGALIGRASDAEGKTYWLGVKAAGATREEVLAQFEAVLKEQAAQNTSDGIAYTNLMSEDSALVSEWVESLYQNLAGRAGDPEGVNYWTTQVINGATGGAVIAAFTAAVAAQGNTTEDGQNFAQKQGVADAFTNGFKDFNNLITPNEKAEVLGNIKTMMNGVNKDSQLDQYTEEIIKTVNEYQNIASVQFTKAEDDNLGIDPETGESNLKSSANFTGTYNITDPLKGTIQSSDSATGTEAYLTDTLTVNVTGYDKTTNAAFDLGELPSTTSVEKLVINNGQADVNGSVSADFQYINVNGIGSFNITASTSNPDGLKDISLNSAAGKDNTFTATSSVVSLKTGAGNDNVTVQGTVAKSLNVGAGNDVVEAKLGKGASADLGAGNDKFTGSLEANASLAGGAGDDELIVTSVPTATDKKGNIISTINIDAGTGTDILDLTSSTDNNYEAIASIRGVDTLKVAEGTKLKAAAISGQKMELSGNSLNLNAAGASAVDLSKMVNAAGEDVLVNINNVSTGTVSLATGNKEFNPLKETITVASNASKVTIKGFDASNDTLKIDGAVASNGATLYTQGATTPTINVDAVKEDFIVYANLKDKITKNDINKALGETGKFSIQEKGVFYVVASDSASFGGDDKISNGKVYKVEVGKDGKVSKLDQISTINVADKGVLTAADLADSENYAAKVHLAEVGGTGPLNMASYTLPDGATPANVKVLSTTSADKAVTTLNVSGGDNTQALEVATTTSNKPLTIAVKDTLKSLTTGAGNETVKGDTAALSVATIDLGAGADTLVFSGDNTSITSIKNVETIELAAAASGSYNAIKGDIDSLNGANLKIGGTATAALTIDAQELVTVDLSKIVAEVAGTTDTTIALTNVGSGTTTGVTVKLNAADALAETITLDATALGKNAVTITGFAAGAAEDKVDFSAIHNVSGTGASSALADLTKNNLADGEAYTFVTTGDVTKIDLAKAKDEFGKFAANTNEKAVVIVSNADTAKLSAIYLVTESATDSNIASIELIGTVDADVVQNTWKVDAGTLSLA